MINGELSYCKDCGEPSTAQLGESGLVAFCGVCGSYDLTDMTDGSIFVPEFAWEE